MLKAHSKFKEEFLIALQINHNLSAAKFVPLTGTAGQGGYLSLTSGKVGKEGDFFVAGNQSVMDALGLAVSRESVNNFVQVMLTSTDGTTRSVTTSSDNASGLLRGIGVKFNLIPAQIMEQIATAMFAQTNASSQNILSLLQG